MCDIYIHAYTHKNDSMPLGLSVQAIHLDEMTLNPLRLHIIETKSVHSKEQTKYNHQTPLTTDSDDQDDNDCFKEKI